MSPGAVKPEREKNGSVVKKGRRNAGALISRTIFLWKSELSKAGVGRGEYKWKNCVRNKGEGVEMNVGGCGQEGALNFGGAIQPAPF